MSKIKFLIVSLFFLDLGIAKAQDDLLKELDNSQSKEKEIEIAAFKGLQIGNMQSTKMAVKGELYILISHRFGDLNKGLDNFFGLDEAYTKIGGIYGVTNGLSLGFSRHTHNKIYEFTAKYKIADQEVNGFPVSIAGYHTLDINSKLDKELYPRLEFNNRLAYSSQLLISKKITTNLSLELAPIYICKNLYNNNLENKSLLVLGTGGRYKISKRLSLNLEYAARLNAKENEVYHNPLTLGLDIETGGHIFQLVFSNSQPMNDVAVFSNTLGSWTKDGIYFGFNMYRVF